MILTFPDAFAAAYFAACIVIAGAVASAAFIVAAYLWSGGK